MKAVIVVPKTSRRDTESGKQTTVGVDKHCQTGFQHDEGEIAETPMALPTNTCAIPGMIESGRFAGGMFRAFERSLPDVKPRGTPLVE